MSLSQDALDATDILTETVPYARLRPIVLALDEMRLMKRRIDAWQRRIIESYREKADELVATLARLES